MDEDITRHPRSANKRDLEEYLLGPAKAEYLFDPSAEFCAVRNVFHRLDKRQSGDSAG